MEKLLSIGKASEYLSVTIQTLRRWDESGKLVSIRTAGGHRKYKLSDLDNILTTKNKDNRKIIGYIRSFKTLTDDADKQLKIINNYVKKKHLNIEFIKDNCISLDFNRDGLKSLIREIDNNKVKEVIIINKERIGTFGYEMFEEICKLHKTHITYLYEDTKAYTKGLIALNLETIKQIPTSIKKEIQKYKDFVNFVSSH